MSLKNLSLSQNDTDVFRYDDLDDVERIIEKYKKRIDTIFGSRDVIKKLNSLASRMNRLNETKLENKLFKTELNKELRKKLGITPKELSQFLDSWVAQNVDLVQDVGETIKKNVAQTVRMGYNKGLSWKDIVKQLTSDLDGKKGLFEKLETRAALIARDQMSTLNGTLTKERMIRADIKLYRWNTAGDSRVRETHSELDGKIFSWQGKVTINGITYEPAPDNIYPGSEINCRCVAEPIFEEELA